jgi:hypothetical protein
MHKIKTQNNVKNSVNIITFYDNLYYLLYDNKSLLIYTYLHNKIKILSPIYVFYLYPQFMK